MKALKINFEIKYTGTSDIRVVAVTRKQQTTKNNKSY